MYIYVCLFISASSQTCMRLCMCVCMYILMYICRKTCMSVYVCISLGVLVVGGLLHLYFHINSPLWEVLFEALLYLLCLLSPHKLTFWGLSWLGSFLCLLLCCYLHINLLLCLVGVRCSLLYLHLPLNCVYRKIHRYLHCYKLICL